LTLLSKFKESGIPGVACGVNEFYL